MYFNWNPHVISILDDTMVPLDYDNLTCGAPCDPGFLMNQTVFMINIVIEQEDNCSTYPYLLGN